VLGPNGEHVFPSDRLAILGGFNFGDGTNFAPRGGSVEYVQGYRDQLVFINAEIQETIDAILLRSPEPPVIILQADHGPGSRLVWDSAQDSYVPERMSILNAYYFPDKDYGDLYPEITPVNTFRAVLNRYFAGAYELLDDRSFFSTWKQPYSFLDVTEEVSSKNPGQ
jgi:hypothetical protein